MFSIISMPEYKEQMQQAVGRDNIIYEKYGEFQSDIRNVFVEAARVSSDTLIIDVDTVGTDTAKDLIDALRNYRVARPNTRIIVVAPGRTPGDETISKIVKLGIYDIIAPASDTEEDENLDDISNQVLILPYIAEILNRPSSYSDAARWDTAVDYGDGDKSVKVKTKIVEKVVEKTIEKTVERTLKQQVLAFYTTDNGIDKDDVLTQVACLLAKKSNQKILVIDMNILTPTLDHFFGIDKEIMMEDIYNSAGINTGIKAVYNAIEKNIFAPDLLLQFVIKHKKLENLYILTGVYDINLFEIVQMKHFDILIDTALEVFDTVIINTHPDISIDATYIALKRASSILAVSNANYTYARNMNQIMNYLVNYHRIPRSRFKIVVNNISSHSLDKEYMKKLFQDYEIIGYIPYNSMREVYLNKQNIPFILSRAAGKDIISYSEIIEKLGYIPRISWFDRIFKRKEIVNSSCSEEAEVR